MNEMPAHHNVDSKWNVCQLFFAVRRKKLIRKSDDRIFNSVCLRGQFYYLKIKIKSIMKTGLIGIIMLASFSAIAQRDSLLYGVFPPAPDHYSAGTVVS